MSQTVIHSDTVYLAGQVPNDYSGDITAQTEETLAKVFEKWLAAGPSDDTQRWSEIARGLVAVDGSLPSLPEGGPRVLLKRLTASD